MQIGDMVMFTPSILAGETRKGAHGKKLPPVRIKGRVVYIHPKLRFYIVQCDFYGRPFRETLYFKS